MRRGNLLRLSRGPVPLADLPPLLKSIRRDAAGTPMPSRSLRVPMAMESDVRRLTLLIGCNRSALLRLALQLGLQRISAEVSDEHGHGA